MSQDTLDYYAKSDADGCGYWYFESVTGQFPTNAFEMFKFSGAMRQIKNKKLLQSIWGTYAQIEMSKLNLDRLYQQKREEWTRSTQILIIEKGKIDVPMSVFYSTGCPGEMIRFCTEALETIKETLSEIEKARIEER